MCGIAGIYRFDGARVNPDALVPMVGRMHHRGPDDEGFHCEGRIGLGMRRLSIIDVAGGRQPISNEDGAIWVVMNGEIYNYVELRRELEAKGHRFRTSSDTETIVHLYEQEGVAGVQKLNGMFAFALYDARNESVWIVRDRLGIKPLYYSSNGERLIFASDLTALVSAAGHPEMDRSAFLKYMALAYVPEPRSIYKGMLKLAPGHWLLAGRDGLKIEAYWQVRQFQTWQGSETDAREQLVELLKDSIRLQLRSDVPVGVFLSGGIDSSTIAAMAAQETGAHLRTLTMSFAGKTSSEDASFARQVASQYQTEHREMTVSADDIDGCLQELIPLVDEPIADSAMIPSYLLARAAQREGMKVLLTGAGGDEIFGGYRRHFLPSIGSPLWIGENLPQPWRGAAAGLLSLWNDDWGIQSRDPQIAFGIQTSGASVAACLEVLRKDADRSELIDSFRIFPAPKENGDSGYAYRRMRNDLQHYLAGDILPLLDKTTMARSIEGRVPLLDHRLVEFAFALPEKINLRGTEPKGLLRSALRGTLSENLLNRSKEGFNAPIGAWAIGRFADEMEMELLSSPLPIFEELLDMKRLRALVSRKARTIQATLTLYSLYFFSRWARSHSFA